MNKNKKFLLLLISVVILLFSVSMLFSGCGRRARIVQALKEKESENVEMESIDEDVDTEEVTEEDVDADEVEDEDVEEDEDADTEEVTEKEDVNAEEDIDEDEDEDVDVDEEIIDDEEEVKQSDDAEQFTDDIPFVGSECGNIVGDAAHDGDPVVCPGDDGENNLEVRGLVSFDISGLAGATVIESKISATADSRFGEPFVTYGPLIIKAVYWGSRAISPAEYNLDGVELGNYTKKNFGIQNRNLKEDLQRAIDDGSGRYQLIFYFEMDETDGDSQADNITYYLEDISFNVTYTQ